MFRPAATLCVLAALGACAPTPEEFWAEYTAEVRAAGYMRAERAPRDAPVDAARIARSFEAIAFTFESDPFGQGKHVDEPPMLRRWGEPIAYTLIAEDADVTRLRGVLDQYVARLSGLTGLEIAEVQPDDDGAAPNVLILFGRDRLLRDLADYDAQLGLGFSRPDTVEADVLAVLGSAVAPWYTAPSPCAGQVFVGDGEDGTAEGQVLFAIVLLRAEIPDPLLAICVEEEVAQLLGLFNDDERVRPSIFNDDQEFALLTEHDGQLLRILYDRRLRIGMRPGEAMPIVRRIAAELVPVN